MLLTFAVSDKVLTLLIWAVSVSLLEAQARVLIILPLCPSPSPMPPDTIPTGSTGQANQALTAGK